MSRLIVAVIVAVGVAAPTAVAIDMVGTWDVTPNPKAAWSGKGHVVTIRQSSAAEAGPYMENSEFNKKVNPQVGTYPNYHGAWCVNDSRNPDDHSGFTFYALTFDWSGGGTLYGCTHNPAAGAAFYTGSRYLTLGVYAENIGGSWYENDHFSDPKAARTLDLRVPGPGSGTPTPQEKTYPAPAPGETAKIPVPTQPGEGILQGNVGFIDGDGNPIGEPFDAAFTEQYNKGVELCWILLLDVDGEGETYPPRGDRFGTCLLAVIKILRRYEQLHPQAKPNARAAAAPRCLVFGNSAARRLLRFNCRVTATGVGFSVKPRRRGTKLSRVLGRHKPKLIVGRSKFGTTNKAFTKVRWG